MENLPYLCVCIFEIFDELWTLSSIKFRAIWILEYSDRDGESFLLVRMYSRNLRSTVESFIKFLSKWNFVLFESLNIRMEMENLPCAYVIRVYSSIFDLRSTVDSSNFLFESSNIRWIRIPIESFRFLSSMYVYYLRIKGYYCIYLIYYYLFNIYIYYYLLLSTIILLSTYYLLFI